MMQGIMSIITSALAQGIYHLQYKHPRMAMSLAMIVAQLWATYLCNVLNILVGPQLHVAYIIASYCLLVYFCLRQLYSQLLVLVYTSFYRQTSVWLLELFISPMVAIISVLAAEIVAKVFCCLVEPWDPASQLWRNTMLTPNYDAIVTIVIHNQTLYSIPE